jgi:pimeloyl-ACP methyl ester carboxylesterase
MTSHQLERDGASIHFETYGTPTGRLPLLLTHGYSASAIMWKPNLAALSADRLVITWDLRGHGHTKVALEPGNFTPELAIDDMAAVLDACDVERAAVGGLSLGGYLSLAFHLRFPARVAALLLFDTGPGYKDDEARAGWNTYVETIVGRFEAEGLDALGDSPEVVGGAHDPAGLVLAGRGILMQRDAKVIESLPAIAVPTLVLVGANDKPFLRATDYLAAKIPGAVKHVIPDAGHASNIDQAAAFDEVVGGFLGSLG